MRTIVIIFALILACYRIIWNMLQVFYEIVHERHRVDTLCAEHG